MRSIFIITLLIAFLILVSPVSATPEPSQPVVHAVLFYSPSCGHCQYVITETLIPLLDQYGEQLFIVGVDMTSSGGQVLFRSALEYFNQDQGSVPFLVIGDTFLIGSGDIPEKFPGLIEQYLAQGGLDWPAIPGLFEALMQPQNTQAPTPQSTTPAPTFQATSQVAPISLYGND
jgi:thiol-disulfide isomerase/thioredoxin